MISVDIRSTRRKLSPMMRTVLAILGMLIILLCLIWAFRIDNARHERELNQWQKEQTAVFENHAIEATQ